MSDLQIPCVDRTVSMLEGAKRAFAEKGFDGASMQDLALAAGMSAGNFYRYFPSKNAIIKAIIAQDLAAVERDFLTVMQSDRPVADVLKAFVARIDDMSSSPHGPLWAEIDAAAARRPEIWAMVSGMEEAVMCYLITIFARLSGLDANEARERFSGHASFLIFLFKGAAHRPDRDGTGMPKLLRDDLRRLILETMQRTLDDVAATRAGSGP